MVNYCLPLIDNYSYSSNMLDKMYSQISKIFLDISIDKLIKIEQKSIAIEPYRIDKYLSVDSYIDKYYDLFSEFYNTNFCSKKIVNEIVTGVVEIKYYSFRYKTNKINLYFYIDHRVDFSMDDILVKLTKCFILMEYCKIKDIVKNIYYYPSKFKKELKLGFRLEPENINSGFTTFFSKSANIYIFREEDSDKVFLHELIHSLKLDFALNYDENLENYILENTIVSSNINLSESYTDFYAIIFNILVDSLYTRMDYSNILATELLWQKKVVFHIVRHLEINSIYDIFLKKTENSKVFSQETSVFSYYIIKLILFSNMEFFLKNYPIKEKQLWKTNKQWDFYNDILSSIDYVETIPLISFKRDKYSVRMVYNKLKINKC